MGHIIYVDPKLPEQSFSDMGWSPDVVTQRGGKSLAAESDSIVWRRLSKAELPGRSVTPPSAFFSWMAPNFFTLPLQGD